MNSLQPILSRDRLLLPFEGKIRAMWPRAPHLEHEGLEWAVLSDGPREHIALAAAGYRLPPPILRHYDWENTSTPPFETQKQTAALMSSNRRCYVLSDMGTGKTRSALFAWRYLRRQGCAGKLLVVAPLSTLKFTWLTEAFKVMPHVKAVVLHGTKKRRLKLLEDPEAEIFIINHAGITTIEYELQARKDIDCLVLDELAVYRNNSIRTKRMRAFAERFAWCWGMSGRPMPNAPTDVWNQCRIITPHSVPKYYSWARDVLMQKIDMYRWVPKPGAVETARSWMQPSIRTALDDVVELPPMVVRAVDVELGKEQQRAYARLAREMAVLVEQKQIVAANAGVNMGKLLQVAAGWVYDNDGGAVEFKDNPRKQLLLDLIDEATHKVLIFVPWRHAIQGISDLLTEEEIDHAVIHGSINANDRNAIFNDFQTTQQYRCLLAHPATLAHGLTLTKAATCIWFSPITSLEQWEQSNARIRRPSQQNKQLYLCMQGTPIEKKVYALLRRKQNLQDRLLELLKQQDNYDA